MRLLETVSLSIWGISVCCRKMEQNIRRAAKKKKKKRRAATNARLAV